MLNNSFVQHRLAFVAQTAAKKIFKTNLSIENFTFVYPVGIKASNIIVYDRKDSVMFRLPHFEARVNPIDLLNNRITLSNVRLRQPELFLYTEHEDSAKNFSFLLNPNGNSRKETVQDRKSPTRSQTHSGLSLRVNGVTIVNGYVKFDNHSIPDTPGRFNSNHIEADRINANFSVKTLSQDSVSIICRSVSAIEHSGLDLQSVRGSFRMSSRNYQLEQFRIALDKSDLEIERLFIRRNTRRHREKASRYDIDFSLASAILPSEFTPVFPELATFTQPVNLLCNIHGSTDSLQIENIDFITEENCVTFTTNGTITNIISKENIGFKDFSSVLKTSPQFDSFITRNLAGFNLNIPHQILNKLGMSTIILKINGNNSTGCRADLALNSGLSHINISADGNTSAAGIGINVQDLDLNTLTGSNLFYPASFNIKGNLWGLEHYDSTLHGEYTGCVSAIGFKDYEFGNIEFEGDFNNDSVSAKISISDPNAALALSAGYGFGRENPLSSLVLDITGLDLKALNLIPAEKERLALSGHLESNLKGTDFDSMTGDIRFENWTVSNATDTFYLDTLYICSTMDKDSRLITVESDIADIALSGGFSLRTIPYSLHNLLRNPLPELYGWSASRLGLKNNVHPANNCTLSYELKETDLYTKLLHLPLDNCLSTGFCTLADSEHTAQLEIQIENADFKENHFQNFDIGFSADNSVLQAGINGIIDLEQNNRNRLYYALVASEGKIDGMLGLENNTSSMLSGELGMHASFSRTANGNKNGITTTLAFDSTQFHYKNLLWNFGASTFRFKSKSIGISNFELGYKDQHLAVNGVVSDRTTDTVSVSLANMDMKEWFGLFNLNNIPLSGIASGTATSNNTLSSEPAINASLDLQDFEFLNSYGGHAVLSADWNNLTSRIECDLQMDHNINHTTIDGFYAPGTDSLEFNIHANHTDLRFLNYFTKGFFNNLDGYAKGLVTIFGTTKRLNLKGSPTVTDVAITPAVVNTTFYVDYDTLFIKPDLLDFVNVDFRDAQGHTGVLNCLISHNCLRNISVDFQADLNGMNGINVLEQNNSAIAAQVFATGKFGLKTGGDAGKGIYIYGDLDTAPGTTFSYNLNTGNLVNDQFLTFIRRGTPLDSIQTRDIHKYAAPTRKSKNWLDISLNVNVTPSAEISFFMNNMNCQVNSSGQVMALYDPINNLNLTGVVDVTRGNCNISLQNIIRKDFTILETSKVHFVGNPTNTELDLHAYHMVNSASLYDLSLDVNNSNLVRVRCLMDIMGKLTAPEIAVDLELPQGSAEEKEILAGAITTDEQRNTQVMSLLALGKFTNTDMNATAAQQDAATSNVNAITKATVNSQINNMLGNIFNSNVLSLSSNLSTDAITNGNVQSNREYEGIVEAHLLNNRLMINGNFGYRENGLMGTSNFIGDVEVQFRIVPKIGLSVIGYNRNNNRYFTKTALNTQGIGFVFEKEFK